MKVLPSPGSVTPSLLISVQARGWPSFSEDLTAVCPCEGARVAWGDWGLGEWESAALQGEGSTEMQLQRGHREQRMLKTMGAGPDKDVMRG